MKLRMAASAGIRPSLFQYSVTYMSVHGVVRATGPNEVVTARVVTPFDERLPSSRHRCVGASFHPVETVVSQLVGSHAHNARAAGFGHERVRRASGPERPTISYGIEHLQ